MNLDEQQLKVFIQKTRINRPLIDYDAKGCLQVQVAKQMAKQHEIEIEQGDSIEYVKHETGYVIKDLADIKRIDKDYYVQQVRNVLRRLDLDYFKYECNGKVSRQMKLGDEV